VDKMADMQQETKDLQVCVRSLQEKMEVINQVSINTSYCFICLRARFTNTGQVAGLLNSSYF